MKYRTTRNTGGDLAGIMIVLLTLSVYVLGIIGYIWNIIKIIELVSGDITAMLIVRCVAVLAFPLGAIIGWF